MLVFAERRKTIAKVLALCWLMTLPGAVSADPAWLYEVELPVSAQSDVERNRAAGEGLLIVLSRLTGLSSVPRSAPIVKALARASDYYNQFVFFSAIDDNQDQGYVRLTFQADAVQGLINSASLPVWWTKRPEILTWVALDVGGNREILSSSSQHPIVMALKSRARLRGLPMTLPLMDLDDRLNVAVADVWGKLGESLDAGAARYGAELVLIGRIARVQTTFMDAQAYRGDWEIWLNGEPLVKNFSAVSALEAADIGVDMVANRLAERFAVLPRQLRQQRLAITGLNDPGSYAAFMQYLDGLEFIEHIDVTAIDAATLHIALASRARLEQLMMLLTAEGRLAEDKLHRGLEVQLIWQG